MERRAYPSDLSDAEYAVLHPHLPTPRPRGRPWRWPVREILDAVFYIVRTGAQWRQLPHEYPPWPTVYWWFRRWRLDGTWEGLNAALRERLRVATGRSGRKRHLLVETQGLVLRVKVHTAALQDRAAVPLLLEGTPERFPRLAHVWVDQGYTGNGRAWIEHELGWTVDVVQHPPKPRGQWVPLGTGADPRPFEWRRLAPERTGFRGVLPRRWAVERTFSWLGQSRRLSKDYEHLCETSEALVYATMTRLMARRLARF
jgi:putative transposase